MPYDAEESIKRMNETVSTSLKKTFDLVAKTAMDGSSELQDPSLNPIERMRKAHSRVTLIVEDAMRGLADAHEVMYRGGISFGIDMGAEYFGSGTNDHEGDDSGSQLLPGQGIDKRQQEAIAEISFLKRVVAEQDRRISELEKTVSALERAAKPEIPVVGTQIGGAVPPNSLMAWKTPAAWSRLKHGMSRAQVEAIPGRPTSTKITGPYLTPFYQGDVLGSGSVTGTIGITDDRVWQVNIPVF